MVDGAARPIGRRPIRMATAVLVTAVGLTGCFTGERPTLAEAPVTTGDPAVDEVLLRLDNATGAAFTAGYDLLARFGEVRTPATVVQDGPARRSVTMGTIRFIVDGATTATCHVDTGACSDTVDAALVSNTQLTPDFYATSAAARLRRDAGLRAGPTTASAETIAGQPATCVAVPVADGASTYCALDRGPLARLDAADVVIDMTTFAVEPDETAFTRPD